MAKKAEKKPLKGTSKGLLPETSLGGICFACKKPGFFCGKSGLLAENKDSAEEEAILF